ncbi:MAG: branched-chain amino acid ABC transporter substrate-binding protein [Candidatus Saccharibacteria bacterium]
MKEKINKHDVLKIFIRLSVLILIGIITWRVIWLNHQGKINNSKPIRIGLEAPLTGSQSKTGIGMLSGALLAANDLNSSNGILGRKVEIVPIDDAADPDTGVKAANSAIASTLDAVVGPYNSGVGAKTLPIYIAAGLVPMRFTTSDSTAGLGYTLQPMTSQIAPVATDAVSKWIKAKSVSIIFDSTATYTINAANKMKTEFANAGITLNDFQGISPGANDYSSNVNQALSSNPSLVYIVTYYPEAGLIAKEMNNTGSASKCLADFGAYDDGFVAAAGIPAAQNCPVVGVPAPSDFPGANAYVNRYTNKFNTAPGTWSPYAYDSVKVVAQAALTAGGFKNTGLTKALNSSKKYRGWTGTMSFDSKTGNRIPAPVVVVSTNSKGELHTDSTWLRSLNYSY